MNDERIVLKTLKNAIIIEKIEKPFNLELRYFKTKNDQVKEKNIKLENIEFIRISNDNEIRLRDDFKIRCTYQLSKIHDIHIVNNNNIEIINW